MTDRQQQAGEPRRKPSLKKKTLKDLDPPRKTADDARGGLSSVQSRKNAVSHTASFSRG